MIEGVLNCLSKFVNMNSSKNEKEITVCGFFDGRKEYIISVNLDDEH